MTKEPPPPAKTPPPPETERDRAVRYLDLWEAYLRHVAITGPVPPSSESR